MHCDHIVRRADGGKNLLGNVQTLCQRCHHARTAQQRRDDVASGRAATAGAVRHRSPRRQPRQHPADVLGADTTTPKT
jgi:5-methylcytosine-specific restriction endonuclease McrA